MAEATDKLVAELRAARLEMIAEGHNGWPNLLEIAANALSRQRAEALEEAAKHELERQCSVGAGTFEIDAETGLWNIGMHLDARTFFRALLPAEQRKG